MSLTALDHPLYPGFGPTRRVNVADSHGPKRFRCVVHFNKPAWQQSGKVKWTVHFRDKCLLVDHCVCAVKLETHTQRRQPVAVLRGFARKVRLSAKGIGISARLTATIT